MSPPSQRSVKQDPRIQLQPVEVEQDPQQLEKNVEVGEYVAVLSNKYSERPFWVVDLALQRHSRT